MDDLLVPENFSMVENGVFRSSFPRTKNIPFLRTLNLRSVSPLIPEDYPKGLLDFYNSEGLGIKVFQYGIDGNKWLFKEIGKADLFQILVYVINPRNRPILIHCNKGKHRTGTIIGCLRKLRGWALSSIFASQELRIEGFNVDEFWRYARQQSFDSIAFPIPTGVRGESDGEVVTELMASNY